MMQSIRHVCFSFREAGDESILGRVSSVGVTIKH
jgi:hypothetical protein